MTVSEQFSVLGILILGTGVVTLLFAPVTSPSPAIAQPTTNATTSGTAPPDGTAVTEEHEHSNETATEGETFTVRDSVFALLADHTIPSNGFIHLYDTTPYSIRNGHVAAKIPCNEDSTPMLDILVGVAPNLTAAPLELVANLSTPGELCLYHNDLPAAEQANVTSANSTTTSANATAMITDIAISNPSDEDITLPATSTIVIGINEITKGAHSHEEEQAQAGAP
jgi:hypothetical protein